MKAKKKILIVDDEKIIRDMLSRALKKYTVSIAQSGEEALGMLAQIKPGLVLLDLKMPGIDGIETLKRIKEFDRAIPVIILTAFGTEEIAAEAKRLGAHAFLSKPFDLIKLIAIIDDLNKGT
jgi:two-component system response regulator (stage 0 sporulation protein F)